MDTLYLTQYRAYDPVAGRWLSRDPIGDSSVQAVLPIVDDGKHNAIRGLSADAFTEVVFPASGIPSSDADFTQRDFFANSFSARITLPNELNLYIYANDNPIGFTDPTGEGPIGNFIRACGIVLGLSTGQGAIGPEPPPYQIVQPTGPKVQQGPKPK